jgi:hypothetical protein
MFNYSFSFQVRCCHRFCSVMHLETNSSMPSQTHWGTAATGKEGATTARKRLLDHKVDLVVRPVSLSFLFLIRVSAFFSAWDESMSRFKLSLTPKCNTFFQVLWDMYRRSKCLTHRFWGFVIVFSIHTSIRWYAWACSTTSLLVLWILRRLAGSPTPWGTLQPTQALY